MKYTDIQKIRVKYGISQTKLSEYSGYTKQRVSAWELGKLVPREDELSHLKQVLDDLTIRIRTGQVNLRGHRNTKSEKKASKVPQEILNAGDYRKRTEHLDYTGEYPGLLSSLYAKAGSTGKRSIKGISLFSGCGGLDLGFAAAGVDLVGHVEICEGANKIYGENFPHSVLLEKDINDVDDHAMDQWKEKYGAIDLIIGGPPCQGFSLAGKRDPEDIRNQLYHQYVDIVTYLSPKVFVFENVAKMTSMKAKDGRRFLDKVYDAFSHAGYTVACNVLNACGYGVPQSRERLILVGVRKDVNKAFCFPAPVYGKNETGSDLYLPLRTFRDAAGDLASLESGQASGNDPLHWAIAHPEHVIRWLKDVPEGRSAHENPDPSKRPPSGFNTTYKRNVWDEPCSTISTNFSIISGCRNVHPENTRSLTIREAARAQSFPDEFVFCGKWGEIRKAIGNAVPPLLAYELAKEILKQIWENEDITLKSEKLRDDNKKQHEFQIEAGTKGRLKGHKFERQVAEELNQLNVTKAAYMAELSGYNIYSGNPAAALIQQIEADKGMQIADVTAYWLGGLATAGKGAELRNDKGEIITGSKSDIVMDVTYDSGEQETIGISVKSCKNNAQVALTTAGAFCEMLRSHGIDVSKEAEAGLKMYCGEPGYRPLDGYVPADPSNIPVYRTARPERWYWEELSSDVQDEWEEIFTVYQDPITIMILQKANAYRTDQFAPTYILHECQSHTDIGQCQVAVMSVEEFAWYSRSFGSFGLKGKKVQKGKYKGIDLAEHMYPRFGFLQFQPIGNKKNFSELQFNLKSNYYKKFEKLREE